MDRVRSLFKGLKAQNKYIKVKKDEFGELRLFYHGAIIAFAARGEYYCIKKIETEELFVATVQKFFDPSNAKMRFNELFCHKLGSGHARISSNDATFSIKINRVEYAWSNYIKHVFRGLEVSEDKFIKSVRRLIREDMQECKVRKFLRLQGLGYIPQRKYCETDGNSVVRCLHLVAHGMTLKTSEHRAMDHGCLIVCAKLEITQNGQEVCSMFEWYNMIDGRCLPATRDTSKREYKLFGVSINNNYYKIEERFLPCGAIDLLPMPIREAISDCFMFVPNIYTWGYPDHVVWTILEHQYEPIIYEYDGRQILVRFRDEILGAIGKDGVCEYRGQGVTFIEFICCIEEFVRENFRTIPC